MRLIRRHEREGQGISLKKIESPSIAKGYVQQALDGHTYRRVEGLDVRSYGRVWSKKEILDAVEASGAIGGIIGELGGEVIYEAVK